VMPELAIRLSRRAGDLETDQTERAALLAQLAASGTTEVDAVRAAIRAHRLGAPTGGERIH